MVLYKAKRHTLHVRSRRQHMHHFAWGIICVALGAVLIGMWSQLQVYNRQNADLMRQLALANDVRPSTCLVTDNWKADETRVLSVMGRDLLVHVPADFTSLKYYPLLLFYPGKGATANGAQQTYSLDKLPAITVYPYPTIGKDGYTAWQGAPYSSGADDVAFTAAILDRLQAELCVDKTRVYAAGLSNGGGFVSLLSCELSDRIAAFVITSAALYAPHGQCKPPRPTPLITIHGDQDQMVPYNGSLSRTLPSIDAWSAYRASLNGCEQPTVTRPQFALVVTTWTGCNDGAEVQNMRIEGGGHGWGWIKNDHVWQYLNRFSL